MPTLKITNEKLEEIRQQAAVFVVLIVVLILNLLPMVALVISYHATDHFRVDSDFMRTIVQALGDKGGTIPIISTALTAVSSAYVGFAFRSKLWSSRTAAILAVVICGLVVASIYSIVLASDQIHVDLSALGLDSTPVSTFLSGQVNTQIALLFGIVGISASRSVTS